MAGISNSSMMDHPIRARRTRMTTTKPQRDVTMNKAITAFALTLSFTTGIAGAGALDPDCTAEKAAKSTAMKSTVGVGGRCSPAEAAKDTAKRATGIDDKGSLKSGANTGKDAAKKSMK